MSQRYLRAQNFSLQPTELFKELVLHAVAIAPIINPSIPGSTIAPIIDEVSGLTAQLPRDRSVGMLVHEYMMYRFAGGPEPEWHRLWMDAQDREDAAAKEN